LRPFGWNEDRQDYFGIPIEEKGIDSIAQLGGCFVAFAILSSLHI
jgi:hypothetical protein